MEIIYDNHEKDYKVNPKNKKKLELINSWLTFDSLDYWRHNRMLSLLKPFLNPNEKWLTVGDGRYGSEAAWLKRNGIECHASDMHTELLEMALEKGLIDSYSKQNAENLDFKSETFDYVLIKESLHHLPRPWLALYEAFRVCKKGVLLIEPNDNFHHGNLIKKFFIKFKNLLKRLLKKKVYRDEYGFEEVGNFIYTINNRELEKFLLGMHKRSIAFNKINDHYFKNIEYIKINSRNIKDKFSFLKLRISILLKDLLCKIGILNESIGEIILFKINPKSETIKDMEKYNWKLKKLPRNPYL